MESTNQKETVMKAKLMLQMIVVALVVALAASFAGLAKARTTPASEPARHASPVATNGFFTSPHSSAVSLKRVRARA